jgi:hypothetical protein
MIIYLFTLNQEITLPSAHLIASDQMIFSHLLKFYLSLLFQQSGNNMNNLA